MPPNDDDRNKGMPVIDPEIESSVGLLGSEDQKKRQESIKYLTKAGKNAIAPLLKALNDDNELVREGAAWVLGKFGEPAVPTLMKLLATGNERVREGAAQAIGIIGVKCRKPITDALGDKDYKVRRGAAQALGELRLPGNEDIKLLITALEDDKTEVSQQAALSLSNKIWKPPRKRHEALYLYGIGDYDRLIDTGDEGAKVVLPDVKNPDPEVRARAASLLGNIDSDFTVKPLITLLKDRESRVRRAATGAVAGKNDRRYAPYMVRGLVDPNSNVRIETAWALDRIGWKPSNDDEKACYLLIKEQWGELIAMDRKAIPCLIKCLKDKDPDYRLKCTEVLNEIGNTGYKAINEALKSEDPDLKRGAAEAAIWIRDMKGKTPAGGKGGDGAPKKRGLIQDQIKKQKAQAASKNDKDESYWRELLERSDIEPGKIKRFSTALCDDNEIVRIAAIENLKQSGENASDCLLRLLDDKSDSVRIAAIEALGEIHSKKSAPRLTKLLDEKKQEIRMASAHSLGLIKEPKSIPSLIKHFSDRDPEFRREVADAVARMETSSLPYLKIALKDDNKLTGLTALESLEKVNDPIAISLAVRMLNDSRYELRNRAVTTLREMSNNMFVPLMGESRRIRIQGNDIEKFGIMLVLSGINDKRAQKLLHEFTGDSNEEIRLKAQEYLSGVVSPETPPKPAAKKETRPEAKTDINRLINDLRNSDAGIRRTAAMKIVKAGDKAVKPLIKSIDDKNPEFQKRVAEILIKIDGPAIDSMIEALKTGKMPVKIIIAQSLAKIPDEKAVNALCEILYNEEKPLVRMVAAESLGQIGNPECIESLIYAASNDTDTRVKSAAISSLGNYSDPRAIDMLVSVFCSEDHYICEKAIESLKKSGDIAIPALLMAMDSGRCNRSNIAYALESLSWVPETRDEAISYLFAKDRREEILNTGSSAIEVLSGFLNDEDPDSRTNAIEIIEEIGGEEAIEPLIYALGDSKSTVRKRAESALCNIGNSAIPHLERAVADAKDPNIRTFAMKLLTIIEE